MKHIQTYLFALLISVVSLSCSSINGEVFAPSGMYKDHKSGSFLVSNNANDKLLRLSKDGEILVSSPSLGGKIQDVLVANGSVVALCGGFNGKVVVLDIETLEPKNSLIVGHTPSSIIADQERGVYWITLRHEKVLIAVDMELKEERCRIEVGREPIDIISYNGNDNILVACNLPEQSSLSFPLASSLKLVDLVNKRVASSILLPNGSTDVKSVTVDGDGRYAYVTHLLARYQLPTNQVDRGWMTTNCMSIVDLEGSSILSTILLDTPQRGAANPWQVAVSQDGSDVIVALAGTHEIAIIDRDSLHSRIDSYMKGVATIPSSKGVEDIVNDASFLYGIREFVKTNGNGCRSFVELDDAIYAANYFSGDIVRIAVDGDMRIDLVSRGTKSLLDSEVGRGEMYFNDANLCFQQWQTCASCHPNDARMDGLNWDLLNDGMGNSKNTKSLLHSHETPPAMVTGIRANAEVAVRSGFKHILFAVVNPSVFADVDRYLISLRPEKSPHLLSDGTLPDSAKRGKEHFAKHCLSCHSGTYHTDKKQYVVDWSRGSERGKPMDVTTLVELWRTAPYLYDGRAYTIGEMLEIHGPEEAISKEAMEELESYLLTL